MSTERSGILSEQLSELLPRRLEARRGPVYREQGDARKVAAVDSLDGYRAVIAAPRDPLAARLRKMSDAYAAETMPGTIERSIEP